jgi:hypothetical protein
MKLPCWIKHKWELIPNHHSFSVWGFHWYRCTKCGKEEYL